MFRLSSRSQKMADDPFTAYFVAELLGMDAVSRMSCVGFVEVCKTSEHCFIIGDPFVEHRSLLLSLCKNLTDQW